MLFRAFYENREMEDIESHLRSRGVDPNRTGVVYDKKTGFASFFLYNLSGKLVGYQHYNPKGTKHQRHNQKPSKELLKYYSYVTGSSKDKSKEIAVWGLESYDLKIPYLFAVEGIFDAVSLQNAGVPAIAVLANDPDKKTRSWLRTLPQKKIVIYDNDEAESKENKNKSGNKLIKAGDYAFTVPEPYKDVNEMPQEEVNAFVNEILRSILNG